MKKIFSFIRKHKIVSIVVLAAISAGGYFGYESLKGNKAEVRYVTAAVEKGTLITSVSGSGQVSASDQIDIKAKASGDLTTLNIKNGQEVKAGDLLAQIDDSGAKKSVRDAKTALETARLELSELISPPDEVDALKAESDLASAKRNLEELVNPSEDTLSQTENLLISAQDTLTKLKFSQETAYQNAVDAKQKAEDNLVAAYEDSFNAIASAFLDLPTLITGLRDVLYSYEIGKSEIVIGPNSQNTSALKNSVDFDSRDQLDKFINSAESNYKTAREKYDANFENYKNASRYSDKDVIEALLNETLETTRAMAETVKSETNMFDYWVDCRSRRDLTIFSKVTAYQTDIKSYTSKTNSHLSSLLSEQRSLNDSKEAIPNAERDLEELGQNQPLDFAAAERAVKEKEDALAKLKNPEQYDIDEAEVAVKEKELALSDLKAGADELDIRAKKIAVQQKEDALLTAQENLADYDIHAPFDGVIAGLSVKKGDSMSSGATVATLITKQQIAEIALNEVDAAQVKVGQKATLQFDAVENLSITAEVAEIDTLGTVSQGVVSYNVKIVFDVQDERIKPSMSVSVDIITESKQDVLLAPLSAVKLSGDSGNYAEVLVDGKPQRKTVTTGSSSDTMIEITEGLEEGEEIISQTISSGASLNGSSSKTQNGGPSNGGIMRMF